MVGRVADSSPKVPDPRRHSVSLSLPPPLATTEATLEGGGVAAIRRYGNPDGPRLLMSHGNGLAIELYYPYWSLLLDDFDLMLFDLRNHGANALGAAAHHTVPAFCRDVEAVGRAVDREYGARPRAGVYHSASSLAALLSPSVGVSYAALVLFDPPLFPPGAPRRAFEAACRQAAQRTRIRTFRFRSEDGVRRTHERPARVRPHRSGSGAPDGPDHAAARPARRLRTPLSARVRGEHHGFAGRLRPDGGPRFRRRCRSRWSAPTRR